MANFIDELELDDETPSERLARELAESDIKLIHDLRRAREDHNLSQAELGALLGVSQASVSAFESGTEAKLSTIRRYAHALGVVVTHSTRRFDAAPEGFLGSSLPSVRSKHRIRPYAVSNSKLTDFALAA